MNYTPDEIKTVCERAKQDLLKEPMLIDVRVPIHICGDIHGQFNDLINMFILVGRPPRKRYLFLGDYVDRGAMSMECAMMLLAYKIKYPKHLYMLRGNHECARVSKKYGFYDEVHKAMGPHYGKIAWGDFQRVFNVLPAGALVERKVLCMHGGLSPLMNNLDAIRKTKKPVNNPFKVRTIL